MIDFISGFFTWAELDEEPIEVREEVVEPKTEEKPKNRLRDIIVKRKKLEEVEEDE